jgi:hypothetical protein
VSSEDDPWRFHRPRGKNYRHYGAKVAKARKEYVCRCGRRIAPGERYEYSRTPMHDSLRGPPSGYLSVHLCAQCAGLDRPPEATA